MTQSPGENGNGARRHPARRALIRWHRRLGITSAIIVVLLSVTGILLGHSREFGLDRSTIESDWLLSHYGMTPTADPIGVFSDPVWVVLMDDALYLFTEDGALVETLKPGLAGTFETVGLLDGDIVLGTDTGAYRGDATLSHWSAVDESRVAWATKNVPPLIRDAALNEFRGEGLPADRVLLDLHTGKLFGRVGVWVVDIAALVFLFLAGSGLVIWVRNKRG